MTDQRTAKFDHKRATRRMYNRKLKLQYGHSMASLDWQDICDLTACSRSTAYRWIDDPTSIPNPMLELLQVKTLGMVPGWGPEWTLDREGVWTPNRKYVSTVDLENLAMTMQLNSFMSRELETLAQELERVKQDKVKLERAMLTLQAQQPVPDRLPSNVVDLSSRRAAMVRPARTASILGP